MPLETTFDIKAILNQIWETDAPRIWIMRHSENF